MKEKIFNGIVGGFAIGLGCVAYVSVDNKALGAFLFSIGLITICSRGFGLFTGIICKTNDALEALVTLLANAVGAAGMVGIYLLTGVDTETARIIASNKLNRSYLNAFASAVLCEVCIYIAVIGYGKIQYEMGKYLSIVLGVMVFVLCGFEHSVADMFYIGINLHSPKDLLFVLVVAAGNVAGAVLMRFLDHAGK